MHSISIAHLFASFFRNSPYLFRGGKKARTRLLPAKGREPRGKYTVKRHRRQHRGDNCYKTVALDSRNDRGLMHDLPVRASTLSKCAKRRDRLLIDYIESSFFVTASK